MSVVALGSVRAFAALVPEPAHDGLVFAWVRRSNSTAGQLVIRLLGLYLRIFLRGFSPRDRVVRLVRFSRRLCGGIHHLLVRIKATAFVVNFFFTFS